MITFQISYLIPYQIHIKFLPFRYGIRVKFLEVSYSLAISYLILYLIRIWYTPWVETLEFHSLLSFSTFLSLRETCLQWNQCELVPNVKIHKKKCCFYNKKGKSSSFLEGKMEVGISTAFLTLKGR